MESLWLLPLLLFIFFIVIGQVFKFYLTYNPLDNEGLVIIKIWGIKIKNFSFQIKPKAIIIRTAKQTQNKEYSFSDPKIKFYEKFSLQVKEKIKLKNVDFYSKIGTLDACQTSIYVGVVNVISKVIFAYIKNVKPTCSICINNHADYDKKICNFSLYAKLSLSIFDFVYCLLFAWLEKNN